ncbi:permease [Fervidobacterium thailandense]|uniref:Permease n=1 Tax=Fervidobacterium thailandense TaxID=1008305 RepID=A0A1E3G0W1_9BACT|nr:permease [Fervidobacterium thailandense]ODN29889.1 permease [Fervidobacterium thailandense]
MKELVLIVSLFLIFYLVPFDNPAVNESILNGLKMLNEYAREHVLLCLVPAFFIAGTISALLKKETILKLLSARTKRYISYPVAATGGAVLAVCSCTILPLFGGIYKKGAGIGPATTFLFAGPAINISAVFLTARVLGWDLGLARLIATLTTAILIGLVMEVIFQERGTGDIVNSSDQSSPDDLRTWIFFFLQLTFLVFSTLKVSKALKIWLLVTTGSIILYMALFMLKRDERAHWLSETLDFAKRILPYLFLGVFIAGILTKVVSERLITLVLGRNDFFSSLLASIIGAFTYFATLTEVPIVQALQQLGMAKGPTLALLMAGNSISLPSMIVITKLIGKRRAFVYFGLVVFFSAISGFVYGLMG